MKRTVIFVLTLIFTISLFACAVSAYDYDGYDYYDDEYYYSDDYAADEETDGEWTPFTYILPALIVGFIIALIVVLTMKSGMKTVHAKSGAADYMVPGSLSLTVQRDTYLYKNVTRTPRPKNKN